MSRSRHMTRLRSRCLELKRLVNRMKAVRGVMGLVNRRVFGKARTVYDIVYRTV